MIFQVLMEEVKITVPLNSLQHSTSPKCIPNLGFLCHKVKEICSTHDFKRPKSEVKVTVTPKLYATINNTKMHLNMKFAEICLGHHYSRMTEARGQGQGDSGT